MPIYWSLKSVPELAGKSRSERGRAWRSAYGKTFRHWQVWVALASCGLLAMAGSLLGREFGVSIVGAAIGGGIGGMVFAQTAITVARRFYPHILRGEPSQETGDASVD